MADKPIIVWFRHDLRLTDNIALSKAAETGQPIIALYIYDQKALGKSDYGAASKWWLHHNLADFQKNLKDKGLNLVLREGRSLDILKEIIKETGAESLFYNRLYEPWSIARDKDIKETLKDQDIDVQSFQGHYLFEPWQIKNKSGDPYKVFTPYYKTCMALEDHIGDPLPVPHTLKPYKNISLKDIKDLGFLPKIDWDKKLESHWEYGEDGAHNRFNAFLDSRLHQYKDGRNRPDKDYTSMMSPYLRFGIISPRSLWHACRTYTLAQDAPESQTESFLRELIWREFCNHLLFYNPEMPEKPLQEKFEPFPWKTNKTFRHAWEKGRTGYPIVDAGMRQMWETGWMHNRVRMIVGSIMVKHFLQAWQDGEAWFWDCLIDGDLANNSAGWQWIAGCGADAAPYFRVFNPILQGEKFDPDGDYVRQYVPELKDMPSKYIHKPWEAPKDVLDKANVVLDDTYPSPVIDHKHGRERALEAFESLKG